MGGILALSSVFFFAGNEMTLFYHVKLDMAINLKPCSKIPCSNNIDCCSRLLPDLLCRYFLNRQTSVTANDGVWHHICVTWESSSGSWKFYKDCKLKQEGTDFKRGYTIKEGGTLVLGQEQDSVGGDFDSDQSFQGKLSNVNVWDKVLPATQIKDISSSCLLDKWNEANVYKWSDFLRQGGPKLLTPSTCEPFRIWGR